MVHADAATIPEDIHTKDAFYEHLYTAIASLVDGQRSWVSNLANASSLIYFSLNRFQQRLAQVNSSYQAKTINWAGFYLLSPILSPTSARNQVKRPTLLLGPFVGLPACQQIASVPGRGVCADASAVMPPTTVVVPETEKYPGHIACDSASQSEIVVPLVIPRTALSKTYQDELASGVVDWAGRGDEEEIIIGVLDIDCEAIEGFDDQDRAGLERIAQLLSRSCDW